MNKTQLLRWLTEEQQKFDLLLAAIGEHRMEQPGVNDSWSMRDIVAHLAGWQRRLVANLEAAANGQPEPPAPWPAQLTAEDDVNAWIYEDGRTRRAGDLLAETHALHEQLLATIGGLPDDARIETIDGKFPVVWLGEQRFAVGELFHHFYDDHAADVRAWLERAS